MNKEPSAFYMAIINRIKKYMKKQGKMQKDLGEYLQITTSDVSRRLSCQRYFTIEEIVKVSDFLEVSLETLVLGTTF